MRLVIALSTFVVVLVAAGAAEGGGWATVGLANTPDAIDAGEEWVADITVLRHGRTPTDGARPSVTIRERSGGRAETFRATPSGTVGGYEATVVFPAAGTWAIAVDNGLAATGYGVSETTTFGVVDVAAGSTGAGDGADVPLLSVAAGALAVLAVGAAGVFGVRRLRRLPVASQ
jgi:hypothetical protein